MTTVKLKPDVIEFFESNASMFVSDGKKYMYYPFWIKETEDKETYEIFSLDNIPKNLKENIERIRENQNDKSKDVLNYPHKQLDIFEDGLE